MANYFAVLDVDDDDDFKVVGKTQKTATNNKAKGKPITKKPTETSGGAAPGVDSVTEKYRANSGSGRNRSSGGRGRGRGDESGTRRKREYDRRPGTGRGKEVSKNGAGRGNWGTPEQEAAAAEQEAHEVGAEATAEHIESAEGGGWGAREPEPEPEPEVPTYTLEEYRAMNQQSRANTEIFGEVAERQVEKSAFNGLRAKEEGEDTFMALGGGKVGSSKTKNQRSTSKQAIVDVGFKPQSSEPSFQGGRGGRGEGRGGRGRDSGGRGGRGGRGRESGRGGRGGGRGAAIDISDANAFPSL